MKSSSYLCFRTRYWDFCPKGTYCAITFYVWSPSKLSNVVPDVVRLVSRRDLVLSLVRSLVFNGNWGMQLL